MPLSKRVKQIAEMLDGSLMFQEGCARLIEKGSIGPLDFYGLRLKVGKEIGLPLSRFWNSFIELKLGMGLEFRIANMHPTGKTRSKGQDPVTGEDVYFIEVFPEESTLDDVKRAYAYILEEFPGKKKFQAAKYKELMPEIFKLKDRGLTDNQIAETLDVPVILTGENVKRLRYNYKDLRKTD